LRRYPHLIIVFASGFTYCSHRYDRRYKLCHVFNVDGWEGLFAKLWIARDKLAANLRKYIYFDHSHFHFVDDGEIEAQIWKRKI